MEENKRKAIGAALGRIPQGIYILTARHEERRGAMVASWVQQAGFEPPMVSLAIGKGRGILPIINGSRRFGLCQVSSDDKAMLKKFMSGQKNGEDPFVGVKLLESSAGGVPILAEATSYLECEVVRHMDFEGDHDFYVGVVRSGGYNGGEAMVRFRENGFTY